MENERVYFNRNRVIELYAEGLDGLSHEDCVSLVDDSDVGSGAEGMNNCSELRNALGTGAAGEITPSEQERLSTATTRLNRGGLSLLMGDDGKNAGLRNIAREIILADPARSVFAAKALLTEKKPNPGRVIKEWK